MIGRLRGAVVEHPAPGEVIVEVAGVGYRLSVPSTTEAILVTTEGEVVLHVHTHVREDAIVLYGFGDGEERRCFEALLGAHGVGPSLALAILSALSPQTLSQAVHDEDAETLCTVPGVGRKTAARLLLELRSRLGEPPSLVDMGTVRAPVTTVHRQASAALAELGFGSDEIREALQGEKDGSVESLVRAALRTLDRST